MATVQELETAIANLKSAADAEKAQVQAKLQELEEKLDAAQIPDTVLADLQATTQEIKDLVASPVPEVPAAAPEPVTVTTPVDNPPAVAATPF